MNRISILLAEDHTIMREGFRRMKHREHLMKKLDIHDPAGLTRYAISAGFIEKSVLETIL